MSRQAAPFASFYSIVDSGCWIWTRAHDKYGYGKYINWAGKTVGAHRESWEREHKKPVPEGLWVVHTCGNRACVNPAHLELWEKPQAVPFSERYEVSRETGCWLWTGALNPKGYGCFGPGRRKNVAHRESWIRVHGTVPPNKMVLHKCNNRRCVNPDHLYLGDAKDNHDDMVRAGTKFTLRKLTPETAVQIREYTKTHSRVAAAQKFGVSKSTVNDIVWGKTWV